MDLTGKVALVTGASSGIGRAIAERFAQAGASVVIHDVNPAGQAVADAIGGRFVPADLSDQEAVRELARSSTGAFGPISILVNNAGFQHIAPVDEFPEHMWNTMLQVLLTAPFQLIKYLLPAMKQQGWGRIINVSSVHGLVASPYKAAYITAKHGLMGLTKTVALEVGTAGITVNALCPAYVRTPLVENQIADQARTRGIPEAEVIERVMLEPAAIKRLIEPAEVANLALFLASEHGSCITGATYTIDLGWTAR